MKNSDKLFSTVIAATLLTVVFGAKACDANISYPTTTASSSDSVAAVECTAHRYSWAIDSEKHYFACEICRDITESGEHGVYSQAVSPEKHYNVCKCGKIESEEEHTFDTANGEHEACTSCGYIHGSH